MLRIRLALAVAASLAAQLSAQRVAISDADHEGRAQFKIETARATWFYDKAGGGFSRLIDRDGRDWIAFKKDPLSHVPASAAAGFRGIPNLVFGSDNPDAGVGHPGFDLCMSTVVAPDTLRTESKSGRWAWSVRFTEENATFTVERVDPEQPYWFLYEGPVGGRWSPSTHFFGTDLGGPRRDRPHLRAQLFDRWRWAYFGDEAAPRVLLAAQHAADRLDDTLWYMGAAHDGLDSADGMVVFGFGRGKSGPQFRGAGQRFTLGFVEVGGRDDAAHAHIAAVAQRWLEAAPPAVRVSEVVHLGDMDCFKIETPSATYLYGKRGAGFASIIDPAGRDWISYAHGNLSAGEYRGLPKCGQPTKYFHCGYGFGQYTTDNVFASTVTLRDPGHVRIRSETVRGDAVGTWDFYATHATFTLERIPGGFWFIYEGTPGGALDPQDIVIRPRGHRTPVTRPWSEPAPWVAVGASESPHRFLLVNHQDDGAETSYVSWPYTPSPREPAPLMTILGFGRPAWDDPAQHTPPLTRLPARYTVALTDAGGDTALAALAAALRR